jgi:hypothetical protein
MTLRGKVTNGVVVFENDPPPNGTLVEVTPVDDAIHSAPSPTGGRPYSVSPRQRTALLQLIGLWKIDNPPSDEEVERIVDDHRMRKHG